MGFKILIGSLLYLMFTLGQLHAASYADLSYTAQDRTDISNLLETLSSKGLFQLLGQKSELDQLGARIEHVHPLKFLEIIVTDTHLKSCLQNVDASFFKRSAFMKGLSKALRKKSMLGEIEIYASDFSKAVKLPTEQIESYFREQNWKGLVKYLLASSS